MSVNWGNSISISKKHKHDIPDKFKLWTDLIKPRQTQDLIGNKLPISQINDWFIKRKYEKNKTSKCLLVHGSSGVGKSSAVNLIARQNEFNVLETYANSQRTPRKMESLFRELSIMDNGVLLLDDAESFLKETSIVKPLTRIFKNNETKNGNRVLCVIICNIIDKSLNVLKDSCDSVEFKLLDHGEIYKIFINLSRKVLKFCYIPPMASYMVSINTDGNITQAVNQMQFMYQSTPFPVIKSKKNKRLKLDNSSKKDNSFQMWISTYKQSNIECFIDKNNKNILNDMCEMNKAFLDNLGNNLHKEYLNYFHNATHETMSSLSICTDYISQSDIKRPEYIENDSLYESENSSKWSEDDTNYLVNISGSLSCIRGKKKKNWIVKKHKKMVFNYPD